MELIFLQRSVLNLKDLCHCITIGDFRSDPGPTLLQPLVVNDEEKKRKSFPSSSSRVKDEKTGLSATNEESSPPRKRVMSSYRKSDVEVGRRMPVKVEKRRKQLSTKSDGNFDRRRSSESSDNDDVQKGTNKDSEDEDGNEGYHAPFGMTFLPMSSACDESTDGELEI